MLRKLSSVVDVRSVLLSICVGQTGVVISSVTRDRLTHSFREIVVGHVGLAVTIVTFGERNRGVMSQWTCGNSESNHLKKNQYFNGHDVCGMVVKRNQFNGCNTSGVFVLIY
jgi:hypothetical protein